MNFYAMLNGSSAAACNLTGRKHVIISFYDLNLYSRSGAVERKDEIVPFGMSFCFCFCFLRLYRILSWEIRVALPGKSQMRQGCATHPTLHAVCFSVSIIHRALTWTP